MMQRLASLQVGASTCLQLQLHCQRQQQQQRTSSQTLRTLPCLSRCLRAHGSVEPQGKSRLKHGTAMSMHSAASCKLGLLQARMPDFKCCLVDMWLRTYLLASVYELFLGLGWHVAAQDTAFEYHQRSRVRRLT